MRRWVVRDIEIEDEEVGQECEAYLAGTYLAWLAGSGLPIAGWAHLNRVAHATAGELAARLPAEVPERPSTFADAAATIEAIVLATTPPEQLPALQRDVLVPLELEVMDHAISPRAAVERVTRALF